MTRFDELPRTYATLRFEGDNLDPAHISAILPVAPKRSHRKGEKFHAGPRAGALTGRTGIWYFDTRDMASRNLCDHLRCIVDLLYPGPGSVDRVVRLRAVMDRERAAAHVSCFWYGRPGTEPPAVPNDIRAALARLPAELETDFHTAAHGRASMGTLFRSIAISQNFREDLATDALHYFLQRTPHPVREKLRAGFASLWASIPSLSLSIDRYETRVRAKVSGGIPDMTGYDVPAPGSEAGKALLVESKFGAKLTPAQLDYPKDLTNEGLLLFIVPDRRRDEVRQLARAAASVLALSAECIGPDTAVSWFTIQDDKAIAVAGWGEVIKALERGMEGSERATPDQVQIALELKDLRWFCERKQAMQFYEPLPHVDIARPQTAEFIMSLFSLIDQAVGRAYERGVIIEKAEIYPNNDKERCHGYEIQLGRDPHGETIWGWFGLYFDAWRRDGRSPIWLQFYGEEIADRVKAPLSAFGELSPDDEQEWLGPICPEAGVPEFTAVEGLVDKLAEFKDALRSSGLIVRDA
jgi:hypothetical protein